MKTSNITSFYQRRRGGLINPDNIRAARRIASFVRQRFARSYTQTRRRNKQSSGQGVTTQNDRKLVYRKKRMPLRRRRRWKLFVNKIKFINEKDMGTRTVVFNKGFTDDNETNGNQGTQTLALYPLKSTDTYLNDLNNIQSYENGGDPTAATGDTVENTTRFLFQSAVLDVTIKNDSQLLTGGVGAADSRAKLELDVYELMLTKDATDGTTNYVNLGDIFGLNVSDGKGIGGGTEIAHNSRGATPFDMTYCLSRFGIKILKKTKFFLPNQDTMTYQIRDPKRRVILKKEMSAEGGFVKPGWTRVLYITFKLVPGLIVGVSDGMFRERIQIGATRKYSYKIEGIREDRTRLVANT